MNELKAVRPVSSLAALRAIADSQRHRMLTLLITEPLSARDLSERLRIARTRVYYHLNLLQEHGFITVVDERIVSGLNERIYRATARRFQVDRALHAAGEPEIADAQEAILESSAPDRYDRLRADLLATLQAYGARADAGGASIELAIALFETRRTR